MEIMDGDRRRKLAAIIRPARGHDSPARRLVAWLQLLFKAFVQRYSWLARWDAAGRPAFLLLLAFLVQKNLRRSYLLRQKSRLQLRAAAAVTVQAAFRSLAARRELSIRRQTRAAVCIQANAERERLDEVSRLHEMVDVLQQAVEDAEVRVIAEREAATRAIADAPPVIKETVVWVEDTEKVSSWNAEVGRLKGLLGAEMQATFDTKKELAKAELRNEKLARLLGVQEIKNKTLQDSLKRMEERVSDLDAENRMLRQAVASTPAINSPASDNHKPHELQVTAEDEKTTNGAVKPMTVYRSNGIHNDDNSEFPGSNDSEAEKQQQELLIKCITEDLGFSTGRPIAAYLIYRCLVQWKSFEADRTTIFDRVIQKISAAIEARDSNETLSYWLSNSCTLLLLLQRTLKNSGSAALARQRRRTASLNSPKENPAPGHPARSVPDGRLVGGLTDIYQVEAKYPALAFKQQLTALLEKVYGVIRHNLKKELSPLLGLCIQAPRTFVVSPRESGSQGSDMAHQASMAHWQSIIKILTNSLNVLKSNYVPPFLICKLFTQVFSFINVQLFNSLLLRRECCSFSNGEYVKAGLEELEHWCHWLTEEYAGSSWDELKHIQQAVTLLILEEKHSKSLKEITDDFCPALSMQQLYRISTMYCDDKYGSLGIPSEVVSSMRAKMIGGSSSPSVQDDINSFLLDDDFSIPFSVDDISRLMVHVDTADMDLPPLIQEKNGSPFEL
ncbi:unnamed protein product [Alopecurus aequalis]